MCACDLSLKNEGVPVAYSRTVLSSVIALLLAACVGCATSSYTPYLTSVSPTAHPLVAQYSITHYEPGFTAWVEFGPDTNYGRQTSVLTDTTTGSGSVHMNILVAGMLPQTTYHMRAHVEFRGNSWVDEDHTFTTGALPTAAPLPQIAAGSVPGAPVAPAPGIELLNLVSAPKTLKIVATDLAGKIIWYCPEGIAANPMANGHVIIEQISDLQEVDLTCNVVRDVSVNQVNQSLQAGGYSFTIPPPLGFPGGSPFHHDVLVLPNGHWIALCQIEKTFTNLPNHPGTQNVVGDALVDIDLNGNVVWAWSAFDHLIAPYGTDPDGLDPDRNLLGWPDWTHSNAIVYTSDGNLLLSMRHQSWIIKIDYQDGSGSGNTLWKLGNGGDFTLLGGDPTQWFYGQHYPRIVSVNGSHTTVAVFDDGNFRIDASSTPCGTSATAPACYTRAAIYDVDETGHLANVVWDYVPVPQYFSFWGGSIDTLPNGNVEFDSTIPSNSSASQITEVTQEDPAQQVWQMNIAGANAYRGFRIPSLYPGVTWKK